MGRRKKEAPDVHRACIAAAAERLFAQKGIAATTMDDVAGAAKYSKATLYVYFQNKEELVDVLVLKSMRLLYERIATALGACDDTPGRYGALCRELARYHEEYPLYAELALGEINVDVDAADALPVEREIFQVGEQIMGAISAFLQEGMEKKALRPDIPVLQTGFLFWASLSGVITMAEKKQRYIEGTMGISKEQFLETGFRTLFRAICIKEEAL